MIIRDVADIEALPFVFVFVSVFDVDGSRDPLRVRIRMGEVFDRSPPRRDGREDE